MCFSASASFGTSGLLIFAALLAYKKARTQSMKLFALVPFLFALQQSMEGIIWIGDDAHALLSRAAAYIFLIVASSWPALLPGMLMAMETNRSRKQILGYWFIGGAVFSLAAYIFLATVPMDFSPAAGHIAYAFAPSSWDSFNLAASGIYILLTVVPFFISTVRLMWVFGLGVLGTYIVSALWYSAHSTSVWCFFAALLSLLVLVIVSW